jgi:hypothetical protein
LDPVRFVDDLLHVVEYDSTKKKTEIYLTCCRDAHGKKAFDSHGWALHWGVEQPPSLNIRVSS